MAKKKKYPKRPKRNASLATWERWSQRVKDVAAYNKALKEKPRKVDAIISKAEKLKV